MEDPVAEENDAESLLAVPERVRAPAVSGGVCLTPSRLGSDVGAALSRGNPRGLGSDVGAALSRGNPRGLGSDVGAAVSRGNPRGLGSGVGAAVLGVNPSGRGSDVGAARAAVVFPEKQSGFRSYVPHRFHHLFDQYGGPCLVGSWSGFVTLCKADTCRYCKEKGHKSEWPASSGGLCWPMCPLLWKKCLESQKRVPSCLRWSKDSHDRLYDPGKPTCVINLESRRDRSPSVSSLSSSGSEPPPPPPPRLPSHGQLVKRVEDCTRELKRFREQAELDKWRWFDPAWPDSPWEGWDTTRYDDHRWHDAHASPYGPVQVFIQCGPHSQKGKGKGPYSFGKGSWW